MERIDSLPLLGLTTLRRRPGSALLLSLLFLASSLSELSAQTTTPEWRSGSPLPVELWGHRALLLPDGGILVCGGIGPDGNPSRTSQLYSAATGTFRPTINQLNTARSHHLLIGVPDGAGGTRVYAVGGFTGSSGNYRGEASIEVLEFDAAQSNWRWRPAGRLPVGRGDLRGTWDGTNGIVVAGGYETVGGTLRSGTRSPLAERIDIVTGTVTSLPSMDAGRAEHTVARILDENANLVTLVAGGETPGSGTATQILEGSVWNSIVNPPLIYRSGGVGFGDRADIARAFGGFDDAGSPTDQSEWYDVKRGWRTAPRLSDARARFDMTLIAGNTDTASAYLAVAGEGTGGEIRSTEIFEMPSSSLPNGVWTRFLDLINPASEREVAINGANLPVVFGGLRGGAPITGVEILQPLRAADVTFPDEEVGRRSDSIQLSIRNEWVLPVRAHSFRITGSASFFFRGDTANFTIPPGGSRTIRLFFQPGSAGPHSGELEFGVGELTDRVQLRGNAVASTLAVINSPFDGGEVFVRSRKTYCFHILRNDGTDTAVIDSVSIDPAGTFRVVSPRGRSAIPPGDSLEVCVEFAPGERGEVAAAVRVHLADREFPGQTIARGVRRFVTAATVSAECDTVVYAPGTEVSGFIRLENPGDSVVTVSSVTITQSALGLFRLADPSIFPLTLLPGESRLVEVIFSPVRESREAATLTFENNGDTAAAVDLCFVARSRFLSPSQGTVDFGDICVGDSIETTLVLENPGGFDEVELTAAVIDPATELTLEGFAPVTLGPREFTRVQIRYAPTAPGPLTGTLRVTNSQGELEVPIEANALAAARFAPVDRSIAVGEVETVEVELDGFGGSVPISTTLLTLHYDSRLVLPLELVNVTGGSAIDPAGSSIEILGAGRARLTIVWQGAGPVADGPAFGLQVELLRGEGQNSGLLLEGIGGNDLCLARGEATLTILPPCWGPSGGIRTAKASGIYASPQPAADRLSITILNQPAGDLRITLLDVEGREVRSTISRETTPGSRHLTLDMENLPSGLYLIRAEGTNGGVVSTPVVKN